MTMPVEDFVRYDRSARWLLHDAYYRMEPGDVIVFDNRMAALGAAYRRQSQDGDAAMPPILRLTMGDVYDSRFGKAPLPDLATGVAPVSQGEHPELSKS